MKVDEVFGRGRIDDQDRGTTFYSTRQARPSFWISRFASTGPHVPAWYSVSHRYSNLPGFEGPSDPGKMCNDKRRVSR